MLRYTGHPLVDVGAATIGAFVGKRDLSKVTQEDMHVVARFFECGCVPDSPIAAK